MYYRFKTGTFIKADTFEEARDEYIRRIYAETEEKRRWHKCTCLGLSHRYDCPEGKKEIPF